MEVNNTDNTILIWKYLYPTLINDEVLNEYVDGRIYPLIANYDTQAPYILFRRDNIMGVDYTKRPGRWDNKVTFSVAVYAKRDPGEYFKAIEILNRIRNLFEYKHLHNEEINIEDIRVLEIGEIANDDWYVESITFECLAG